VFDVLISGGEVYDGSGAGPVIADVAIAGDRVVQIRRRNGGSAESAPEDAAVTIDATGRLCPLDSSTSSATPTGRSCTTRDRSES
jgi:N-acyl-D-aspartate/D-glutamate deacylase